MEEQISPEPEEVKSTSPGAWVAWCVGCCVAVVFSVVSYPCMYIHNLYLRYLLVFLYVWLQLMLVELFEVNTYFGGLDLVFHTPMFEPTLPACPFHLLGWYETRLECHSRFGVVFPIIDSIIYFTNQFFSSFIPVVFQTPRVMLEYVQLLILWPPRNEPRRQKHPKAMLTFFRADSSKDLVVPKISRKLELVKLPGILIL